MKREDFAGSEAEVEVGPLRHHADDALDRDALARDIVRADPGLAARGLDARGQNTHCRGFAGAVGTEQAEDFARSNFERQPVERRYF